MSHPSPYDIEVLQARAAEFSQRLRSIKAAIAPRAGFWYPYDTLANLWHLGNLLPRERTDLGPLLTAGPVADIGAADGDLAFFLEQVGVLSHVIDHAPTNHNGLEGARLLKRHFASAVEIHDIDLDAYFTLPAERYGLVLFLGILYHLKNPFYVLETLARRATYALVSTRITRYLADGATDVDQAPVAYLLAPRECNDDPTNYWIFSEAGLRRLIDRTGWDVLAFKRVGHTSGSDPFSADRDERAFCLLQSRHR